MPVRVKCRCDKVYNVADAMLGKRISCKHCGATLDVAATPAVSIGHVARLEPEPPLPPSRTTAAGVGMPRLSMAELRDPVETTAFITLIVFAVPAVALLALITIGGFGIPLVVFAILWLGHFLGEFFAAAYIKTNGVRVSPRQLPEIHEIVESCSRKLDFPVPDVYILQQNLWNAFAAKLAGRRIIVLLSGAVDSILLRGNREQLAFVIGHEIGHHAAGHLDFWRRNVASLGGWMFWFLFWYRRREELTCDRVGLYCAGGLEPAVRALLNLTVGAQLASDVDVEEAIRQWKTHEDEFFVRYRTMYSIYPHHLWRVAALHEAAGALLIPRRPE